MTQRQTRRVARQSDRWLVVLGVVGAVAAMAAANLWWTLVSGGF